MICRVAVFRRVTVIRFALAVICMCAVSERVLADTDLFNSNGFEPPTYAPGQLIGQSAWTNLGFGNAPAFAVETTKTNGGTQAVQAFGGPNNDGSFAFPYPNEVYVPAANELIHIQADIARTVSSDSSPVFAIDVYDTSVDRTTRFGLDADDTGTIKAFVTSLVNGSGQFDPNGSVKLVTLGDPVAQNTFVHFDALLDYADSTLSLTIGGTNYGTAIPFAFPSTNLLAATLEIGTFDDSTDSGFFDNYSVSVETVPEPASGLLCLSAVGGGLAVLRKRMKSKDCY